MGRPPLRKTGAMSAAERQRRRRRHMRATKSDDFKKKLRAMAIEGCPQPYPNAARHHLLDERNNSHGSW